MMLTLSHLKDVLTYDPKTGEFVWNYRTDVPKWWNTKYAGKMICNPDVHGYLTVNIAKKTYKAHRLAWFYMTGCWPVGEVDHKDCVRTNNRFANLRSASDVQNSANASLRSDNTSGAKGVCWHKAVGKWCAQTNVDGKRKCLGYFIEKQDALAVYERAIRVTHGEFSRSCVVNSFLSCAEAA